MSDLRTLDKRKLELFLDMGSGYVLDFSNSSFAEFILDSIGCDPYNSKYELFGMSKANRLRGIWALEANHIVAKLINDLADYACFVKPAQENRDIANDVRSIASRLLQTKSVPEIDAITSLESDADFAVVVTEVRDAIERHRPQAGLDRLHTFVLKYVRRLCEKRGILADREKPLQSVFGEYVKYLRNTKQMKSAMADRILKSSISILDALNDVRNNQSLAHDNELLDFEEALLIFNNVVNTIRYLRALEAQLDRKENCDEEGSCDEKEIPF